MKPLMGPLKTTPYPVLHSVLVEEIPLRGEKAGNSLAHIFVMNRRVEVSDFKLKGSVQAGPK